ncbi:unnamed protein product [Dimorphilus gyrociliatus]|uniref:SMAUG/ZCCHC2-like PHAT domain-containing protein n=1 Tax=Dimorphilus gyrociliatus TaxID=2664684 RepID=A0A7I8WDG9_9ANNE|nr:unnamed protein product [Dimorphilus gyrociliatus]
MMNHSAINSFLKTPDYSLYRDQVNNVMAQFNMWNDCEQTVALFKLVHSMRPTHARLLCRTLEQSLNNDEALKKSDEEANDSAYLRRLAQETDTAGALRNLLAHIPLLRPGLKEVKQDYICLIKRLMQLAAHEGRQTEECRQLAMYLVLHPALTQTEIQEFKTWYSDLEQQQQLMSIRAPNVTSNDKEENTSSWPPSSLGDSGLELNYIVDDNTYGSAWTQHRPLGYSGSMGVTNNVSTTRFKLQTIDPTPQPCFEKSKVCSTISSPPGLCNIYNNKPHRPLQRTESLIPNTPQWKTNYHPKLSPQSSGSSSDSKESRHTSFLDQQYQIWLRHLRLKKYENIFQDMTYDEMLNTKSEWLLSQRVTNGAANKILSNIQKLKDRLNILNKLQSKTIEEGSIKDILSELKSIIYSPSKPYDGMPASSSDEEDIISQTIAVFEKVSSWLLTNNSDVENSTTLQRLVDHISTYKTLTEQQQSQLICLKDKMIILKRHNLFKKFSKRSPSYNK